MRVAIPLLLAFCAGAVAAPTPADPDPVTGLTRIDGCILVSAPSNDGDSFLVRFPDGRAFTVRIYGADCIESGVHDETMARRLRAQRRYFGIAGGSPEVSIERAKTYGEKATQRARALLAEPFTVHTSFADARGGVTTTRIYGFVTTSEGRDLAELLVREGLARAFGITRATPYGISGDEYRERLRDFELLAARSGAGVWAHTDWESLPDERGIQRREEAELGLAIDRAPTAAKGSVNPNTADTAALTAVPGIGEATARRIIEGRSRGPYRIPADLTRVRGIGPRTAETLAPYWTFEDPSP